MVEAGVKAGECEAVVWLVDRRLGRGDQWREVWQGRRSEASGRGGLSFT